MRSACDVNTGTARAKPDTERRRWLDDDWPDVDAIIGIAGSFSILRIR